MKKGKKNGNDDNDNPTTTRKKEKEEEDSEEEEQMDYGENEKAYKDDDYDMGGLAGMFQQSTRKHR